jgi:hypothetical protein
MFSFIKLPHLVSEDAPSSGPLHALYIPDVYPEFFQSNDTLSSWLTSTFFISSQTRFCTHYSNGKFIIYNFKVLSVLSLTSFQISDSEFHPNNLLPSFTPLSDSHPAWFYFTKSHYQQSLSELSVKALSQSLCLLSVPHRGVQKNSLMDLLGAMGCSLSFAPSGKTFPHAMAALGLVFDKKALVLQGFCGGISASTYKKTCMFD